MCIPFLSVIFDWCRVIWVLQGGALLVFSICWVAVLDYLVFMFTCAWGHGNTHLKWERVGEYCPKLVVTLLVFTCLAYHRMMLWADHEHRTVHVALSSHHCQIG